MVILKLAKLGVLLILLGIIFGRVVDTLKDPPPSDSRLPESGTDKV